MLLTLDPYQPFHDLVAVRARAAGVPGEPMRATTVAEVEATLASGVLPEVVIGGPGMEMAELVQLTGTLRDLAPDCVVLAIAEPTTRTLRAALRAGMRDVLPPLFTAQELADALDGAGQGSSARPLPGLTIAVFSAKGGVGTSVLASNLALRISALSGAPAILADLDLPCADQAVLHGLRPRFTIQDVADGSIEQDTEALSQALLPVPDTNVRVLAGPLDPAAAESIREDAVLEALQHLRQLAGLVIVDTAATFSDTTLTVLEHADLILLPVSLDMMSLRSLVVTLQTFARLGIPKSQLHIVAIRSDAKVGLTPDDVVRTTGMPLTVEVPSSREVPRSVNTATPLALYATRSAVVRAVDELAELLLDGVEVHGATTATSGRTRTRRSRNRASSVAAAAPEPDAVPPEAPAPAAPAVPDVPAEVAASAETPGASEDPPVVKPVAKSVRRPARVRVAVAHARPSEPATEPIGAIVDLDDDGDAEINGWDAADDLAVSSFAASRDELAAMAPPTFNPTPATPADDGKSRRRRRSNRS